jgi:hypothetical protein
MKTSEEYRRLSQERLSTAQHILGVTYPALKSPRLFLSALEHFFLSMDYAMNAILSDEKMGKEAGNFPKSFSGRYSAFRLRIADKLNFSKEDVRTLLALRNILVQHQKSPTEFERGEKFIICNDRFEMTVISMEVLEGYEKAAASFLARAELALGQPLSIRGTSTP